MSSTYKQFYKGESKDFIVFVDDPSLIDEYKKDSTIPLSSVVSVFNVFTSEGGRGSEGVFEKASRQELENEFGNKSVDEIIELIVKQGETKKGGDLNSKKWESKNDSNGPINH